MTHSSKDINLAAQSNTWVADGGILARCFRISATPFKRRVANKECLTINAVLRVEIQLVGYSRSKLNNQGDVTIECGLTAVQSTLVDIGTLWRGVLGHEL